VNVEPGFFLVSLKMFTMKYFSITLFVFIYFSSASFAQADKMIIEFETDKKNSEKYLLKIRDINIPEYSTVDADAYSLVFNDGLIKWSVGATTAQVLIPTSRLPVDLGLCPLEPGDSVHIRVANDSVRFSGRSSEKFELLYKLNKINEPKEYKEFRSKAYSLDSLSEYFSFVNAFDFILNQQLSIIDSYKGKVSPLSISYLKAYYIDKVRYYCGNKFSQVISKKDSFNLSVSDLKKIYDTTLSKYVSGIKNASDVASLASITFGLIKFAEIESILKAYQIDTKQNENDLERRVARYYYAKEMFSGLAQRKVLAYLAMYILRKNLEPKGIAVAEDFISLPGYNQYRDLVRQVLNTRLGFEKGKYAPAFTVADTNDRLLTLNDLKGKIVFMDFWFTGCKGCVQMAAALKNSERVFENNPKVTFLSISTDGNKLKWRNSILQAKYTSGISKNVYTEGKGREHPIVNDYSVTAFPAFFLIDADGKFINPVPDPRKDNGRSLTAMINHLLPTSPIDGPYVLYQNEKVIKKSIDLNIDEKPVAMVDYAKTKDALSLNIYTDISGKTFEVKLKESLLPEPATYAKPSRVMVLSDIEGEFGAFRELLQVNKVIDENFNWTFGNGHLVCLGDFFDRGKQVTEVLWLIYSLEEKAKAAGGYVHFILGNHEIMNLNGDVRYVQKKYKENAVLMEENYSSGLYGENSELGRWLRTKNVIEKIGDIICVHGGISTETGRLNLTLTDMNRLIRPYYAKDISTEKNETVQAIMNSQNGLFWDRSYYKNKNVTENDIDVLTQKFDVKKIVTGHTIIESGERVTQHFGGRVINTDTHHAEGKSEALLIENDTYYRVNTTGDKWRLFDDYIISKK
jgi:peroxiredoxin